MLRQFRIASVLGAVVVALLASARVEAAQTEVITLRSGNGSVYGQDTKIRFIDSSTPFTSLDFDRARAGQAAWILSPWGGWVNPLPGDSPAKWIGVSTDRRPNNALYAYDFTVSSLSITSARLDLLYAVDNQLGSTTVPGLYLNGQAVPGTSLGGDDQQYTFTSLDVGPLLHPGINTLYFYQHDTTGGIAGSTFSAQLTINPAGRPYNLVPLEGQSVALNNHGQALGYFPGGRGIWQNGAVTTLPTLGGQPGIVSGMNDLGHVIGDSFTADNGGVVTIHGFFYGSDGIHDLDDEATPEEWGNDSAEDAQVTGINNHDQVVGYVFYVGGFIYRDGVMKHFGDGNTWPVAINDDGQVMGQQYDPATGESRPFLWNDVNGDGVGDLGEFRDLGTLDGAVNSVPLAMNATGEVVGYVRIDAFTGTEHAVVWKNGAVIDLGALGGLYSHAVDINDQGQVVGFYDTEGGIRHGFIWQDANANDAAEPGELQDLGGLGGMWTDAAAIDNRGQVTGTSDLEGDATWHPYVWENGVMSDVGTLPGRPYSVALAINDQGWVSARSDNGDYGSFAYFLGIPGNTPAGTNVAVQPTGTVSLTFGSVVSPGDTTAAPTGAPSTPLPPNFQVSGGVYYEIHTTATYTGNILLSIRYDPLQFPDEENIQLLHLVNGQWQNIRTSVDKVNNLVLGSTTSLSPFAVVKGGYSWSGVLQPVNADGSSIFKLGSTVPVKFQLTGESAGITSLTARLYVAKLSDGITGTELEAVSTSAADSGNVFRYNNGQYQFNLGTRNLSEGTWRMRIDMGDNAAHTVDFSLRR